MNPAVGWFLPFALQGLAMGVDELRCHRRRAVSRWEWLGHLADTLVFLGCLACPLLLAPAPANLRLFLVLAAASCLLITKDEGIHKERCGGGEHWLHAVLFILHPLVLAATAVLWLAAGAGPGTAPPLAPLPVPGPGLARGLLLLQACAAAGFLALQAVLGARSAAAAPPAINNAFYDDLGERWHAGGDNPIALLRAETRLRAGWVVAQLRQRSGAAPLDVLDVACGGGLLANLLAEAGHAVTGIDLSRASLDVARKHDQTGSVAYLAMDARRLAFPDGRFDVVCMMDFLEHIEEREEVLAEAARVLKPGGWLFFHTFNRTAASWLVAVKGVEWTVKNTPKHMHVHHLFLTPGELGSLCARQGLAVESLRGVRPKFWSWAFLKLLCTARVSERFQFEFTPSLRVGYCGRACKTQGGLP